MITVRFVCKLKIDQQEFVFYLARHLKAMYNGRSKFHSFTANLHAGTGYNRNISQKGGVSMSFEAIKGISDAEVLAKARIAEAEAQAKQLLADAESAGKAALEAASARAETELRELRKKADTQAAEKTAALEGDLVAEADQLRRMAEQKLETAAAVVVERIVGG